jgi:hypothetical protein
MCLVQVARAILENPEDKTKIYLIYANVTYDDILLKVPIYNLCCLNFVLISSATRVHISGRLRPFLFSFQLKYDACLTLKSLSYDQTIRTTSHQGMPRIFTDSWAGKVLEINLLLRGFDYLIGY